MMTWMTFGQKKGRERGIQSCFCRQLALWQWEASLPMEASKKKELPAEVRKKGRRAHRLLLSQPKKLQNPTCGKNIPAWIKWKPSQPLTAKNYSSRSQPFQRLFSFALRLPARYVPSMHYTVVLIKSEEGYAVGCPALEGCWSQGATKAEALDNIRTAIREVLEVRAELEVKRFREEGASVELVDVEVAYA